MDAADLEALERLLRVLANGNRLHLLVALQQPRRLGDIALPPSRDDAWGHGERAISRQGVMKHLQALLDIGAVSALPDPDGAGVRYVVNHARLYGAVEDLRALATVKPQVDVPSETVARDATGGGPAVEGPRLVLVRGLREGQAYPLRPPEPEGGWTIGRSGDATISLDYDPYVSGLQARVLLREGRHFLHEDRARRNETLLNGRPMTRGGIAPLEPGDLVAVGRSVLLYRR